jgi:hypothetical protein
MVVEHRDCLNVANARLLRGVHGQDAFDDVAIIVQFIH